MKAIPTLSFLVPAIVLAACGDAADELQPRNPTPDPSAADAPPATADPASDPALCKSREYTGFDDVPLHGGRVVAALGVDRARIKPFTALQTEYARVLGNTPASLAGAEATFGQMPPRWYEEPLANAVGLQTAYSIAFDGCLTFTATAPEFANAPDAASAASQCGAMARQFWSKTPSPAETDACASVATKGAATETAPRRKWAYACASVLSSAGFLSY